MDIRKPLIPEFESYADQFGMVQLESDGTKGLVSDNGNLWTSFYVLGLKLKGFMTPEESLRLKTVYANNFKVLGLLLRYPTSPDFNAQDDYCGIMMAGKLLGSDFAKDIYAYGVDAKHCKEVDPREPIVSTNKTNRMLYGILKVLTLNHIKWNYNPVAPDSFSIYSWFGRRMELIAAIQMSAGKPVNLIYWCYWAAVMISNMISKPIVSNSVADVLHYCNAISCENYGFITRLICKAFRKSVHVKFGDAGKMFGWSNQQVNHPLVKFLEGVY
jgi:hypothetical protein